MSGRDPNVAVGTGAGLWGLEQLLARLQKRYGDELAWMTCSALAEG